MRIFAISDLHMDNTSDKPMDVFGGCWENHIEKISEDWKAKARPEDIVLIGGDTSWAMDLDNAIKDIGTIAHLPGKKVLIKGNHDYWWHSISRIREALPEGFYALQNDCVKFDDVVICGSRCWSVPGCPDFKEHDEKLYKREAERLKLSFSKAEKIREAGDRLICLVHYPPFNAKREDTLFTKLFEENGVDSVIYGHLHGKDVRADLLVKRNGIKYYLTSCDQTENKLIEIQERI